MGSLRPRSLAEYLRILWRRKLLIFLFAVAMLVATYVATTPVRDVYEARALVAISFQASDERQAIDVQVATVNQYLLSRSNLEPLIRRYNLYGPKTNMEAAIQQLRHDIKLETKLRDYYPQFPESFTISYRHTDPAIAQQVANDLASFFNNTNEMMEKRSAEEAKTLDGAIAEVEARLGQLNQQRAASQSSGTLNAIRLQRASMMAAANSLTDKEYLLNQQVAEQKRQIGDQEKAVKLAPANDNRASNSYGVLLVRKAQLDAQLKDYLTQYTEKNSKVISTRTELEEINRQLNQLDSGGVPGGSSAVSPEVRELRGLQRELARLETELEITRRDLARKRQALALLPSVDVSPATIASAEAGGVGLVAESGKDAGVGDEYNRLVNRYNSLTERRDTLRRGLAKGGASAALFQVVDHASLPQLPVGPNRLKLMLLAFGLSLAIGLIAALVVEVPRMSLIQDDHDVGYYLGAPVVALIPETLTSAESGRKRRLFLLRALCVLLLAASLVPVLALLLKKSQIIQLLIK